MALLATACSGSNLIPNPEVGTGAGNVNNGVTATFQQPIMEGDEATKALNNNLEFTFEQNAQINVYPSTAGECMIYALTPTAGASATFEVENFNLKDGAYGATYPVRVPDIDPTMVKFSLAGQNQVANNNSNHLSTYDLNFAQADITGNTGEFNFAHQVAWLKVTVPVAYNRTFEKLIVSADEGISNTITLNTTTGAVKATPTSASEKIVVTLNGDNGFKVTGGSTLTIYVTIPAGNYTNLTIQCGSAKKTISGAKMREAGHAYQITLDDHHQLVDLGLTSGLLWSTDNLGVETKAVYGLNYAWGYTTGGYYSGGVWTDGTNTILFNINLDCVTTEDLTDEQDAAVKALGGNYRMPTKADFTELIQQTNHEWITTGGYKGVLFTNKKDRNKQIFFPAGGYGSGVSWNYQDSRGVYRTRTYNSGVSMPTAECLYFDMNSQGLTVNNQGGGTYFRDYLGISIRPVYDPRR